MEYNVTLPAVGNVMEVLAPDPTEGAPPGLKLQLYVYPGTPYAPVVEAVMDPPAQIVVAESVIGVAVLEYSMVFPVIVIVQGDPAPIQALLQPVAPQQDRKNCRVKVRFWIAQLGAGIQLETSVKIV